MASVFWGPRDGCNMSMQSLHSKVVRISNIKKFKVIMSASKVRATVFEIANWS